MVHSSAVVGCVVSAGLLGCVNFLLLHQVAQQPHAQPQVLPTRSAKASVGIGSRAGDAPAPPNPPPQPPPAATAAAADHGLDLDARYPAAKRFWEKHAAAVSAGGQPALDSAPWLAELRAGFAADGELLPPIPHKLHQTWKTAEPPKAKFSPRWARSLRDHNAGWAYRLWTDADNRALVASEYASLLPVYDGYASPIQRADVARYVIAHARGGVYADLDTECFKPFEPLLRRASLVLSYKVSHPAEHRLSTV